MANMHGLFYLRETMKKIIMILLIAASVGVTWFVNSQKSLVDAAVKSEIEAVILADSRFPARPVWWDSDSVLAIGMLKTADEHNAEAQEACQLIIDKLDSVLRVELYDVLSIQQTDKWTLIGSAECRP